MLGCARNDFWIELVPFLINGRLIFDLETGFIPFSKRSQIQYNTNLSNVYYWVRTAQSWYQSMVLIYGHLDYGSAEINTTWCGRRFRPIQHGPVSFGFRSCRSLGAIGTACPFRPGGRPGNFVCLFQAFGCCFRVVRAPIVARLCTLCLNRALGPVKQITNYIPNNNLANKTVAGHCL